MSEYEREADLTAPTAEIVQALFIAGYLKGSNLETARSILTAALPDQDPLRARADALHDEKDQEQLIAGASEYARQDATVGDRKSLEVDREIIQDAINQEQRNCVRILASYN